MNISISSQNVLPAIAETANVFNLKKASAPALVTSSDTGGDWLTDAVAQYILLPVIGGAITAWTWSNEQIDTISKALAPHIQGAKEWGVAEWRSFMKDLQPEISAFAQKIKNVNVSTLNPNTPVFTSKLSTPERRKIHQVIKNAANHTNRRITVKKFIMDPVPDNNPVSQKDDDTKTRSCKITQYSTHLALPSLKSKIFEANTIVTVTAYDENGREDKKALVNSDTTHMLFEKSPTYNLIFEKRTHVDPSSGKPSPGQITKTTSSILYSNMYNVGQIRVNVRGNCTWDNGKQIINVFKSQTFNRR
jgi:hypothetical protein